MCFVICWRGEGGGFVEGGRIELGGSLPVNTAGGLVSEAHCSGVNSPPEGTRSWCERVGADAGIKHGWMTEYHGSGAPKVAGEYRDGLQVGVWTRYYEHGGKRVQAEFQDGLQSGVLISWNPDGSLAYEKYFVDGAPASR